MGGGTSGYYTAGEDVLAGAPREVRETVEGVVRGLGRLRDASSLQSLRAQLFILSKNPDSSLLTQAFPDHGFRTRFSVTLKAAIHMSALADKTTEPGRKALYHLQSRHLNALASDALKTQQERLLSHPTTHDPPLDYEETDVNEEEMWAEQSVYAIPSPPSQTSPSEPSQPKSEETEERKEGTMEAGTEANKEAMDYLDEGLELVGMGGAGERNLVSHKQMRDVQDPTRDTYRAQRRAKRRNQDQSKDPPLPPNPSS